jgi:NlpC/P60 family putative phage cell wall peptidase
VRGVWRDVIGTEPELPPPYTPDWAERSGAETLLLAARRHLHEIAPAAMREGDVLLFRMAAHAPVKHCGVLVSKNTFLHAYWGQSVLETRLASWWRARLVAAFSFPGVED